MIKSNNARKIKIFIILKRFLLNKILIWFVFYQETEINTVDIL